ncbi:fimbrillin family protein [Sphingobacterium deserti]|uniref:Fibrobacter succinogenes major paralogous domain-containing protein n=1 Tax=Sphingobacterium deserti TaxID=1229276 RepID=A0A0B8T733_9SPHI|nr:fimbrillin family protein [Sphingobacterium deserti]KGE14139.1 hypothetical protein DI53_1969 [Sphingobacterium deserti]
MRFLIKLKYSVAIVFASLFILSCSKEESISVDGEARVSIFLEGVNEVETSVKMSAASSGSYAGQQVTVPFNDDFELIATLQTQGAVRVERKIYANGNAAAATSTKTVLPKGTLYRVAVYDQLGSYVTDQVYKVGEPATNVFLLDGGKTYTFLAYSVNSKSDLPSLNNQQKLADVNLANLNGSANLMYFKRAVTVKGGENNVNLVMRNLFSQITTTIDASAVGVIDECSAFISPHYGAVNIRLTDSTITYTGSTTVNNLVFSGFNTQKIVSSAAVLNHPATTNGVLTIAKIRAGGTTRENLVVNNLDITPGVKYNLNLTLSPKNGISVGSYTWAPGNLVYNNGNYGFAENQGLYGDQWQVNALLPIDRGAGSEGQQAYDPAKDPCTKVTSHGGNWRTPTMQQLQSITGANRNEKPIFHVRYDLSGQPRASYNGVGGLFVGTTTQPAPADIDRYMFLPYAGERNRGQGSMGTYWTVTPSSANNERFQFNTGDVTWPYSGQYYNAGGSIRCVKK